MSPLSRKYGRIVRRSPPSKPVLVILADCGVPRAGEVRSLPGEPSRALGLPLLAAQPWFWPRRSAKRAWHALVAAFWLVTCLPSVAGVSPLRVTAFQCDITPPKGEPLVWTVKLAEVLDPLLGKGVVLEEGTNRYVLCALDWCLLGNESELRFRQAIGRAAGTLPERVAVHCLHQHAAPWADEGAHPLLDAAPQPPPHLSTDFLADVRRRLAATVAEAVNRLEPFDEIGLGQARVERVASARRLHLDNGKLAIRFSNGAKNPRLAEASEGVIDPELRMVTFAQAHRPIARLYFYATHPQTFCCDGRASADFVGRAREAVERSEKVPQIYFTGCAGDVTVGKYNDESVAAVAGLAERLEAGIWAAAAATRFQPVRALEWRCARLQFPLRAASDLVAAESRAWLQNPSQTDAFRVYRGAMRLAFRERLARPVSASVLRLGPVRILSLPGEPMLDFQFFAQRLAPQEFVAVAGYGDCGTAYICTEQAWAEGGYETEATNVGSGSEAVLKHAIGALLGADGP